jgi:5-methylcytosine-specific restriction endonuclease McrA
VAKRTPLPCNEVNCGDLFPKCGKASTYRNHKCRCDSCYASKIAENKKYPSSKPARKCRCDSCVAAASEYQRKYREANRERLAAYDRLKYMNNRDEIKARTKRRHEDNREAMLDYFQKRYRRLCVEDPEAMRAQGRLIQQRRRAKVNSAPIVPFTQEQLDQRFAYYGNRCYLRLPGICTGGADEIEHVKPVSKFGPTMLANLRPACLPCNRHKGDKWPFSA